MAGDKGAGGRWPVKRRYAVAVNSERLSGRYRPKDYPQKPKGKKKRARKTRSRR